MTNKPEERATPTVVPDDEELVEVLDTKEESEALVVRGLLESANIEALVSYLDAPQDVLPGVGGIVVKVKAGDADEARRIIDDYRQNADAEAGEAESEAVSEEPTV